MPVTDWLYIVFTVVVLGLLAVDLGIYHRHPHALSRREALVWSLVWISAAAAFNLGVWRFLGGEKALEFLVGYLVEWSLSLDNLFVFLMLFLYFGVPTRYQHRVLFWGILGAVVLRGLMITAGAVLLAKFEIVIYLFGGFLLYSGIRFMRETTASIEPEHNPVLRLLRRYARITKEFHGERFFVQHDGRGYITPLLVVLLLVETSDIVFAVDSVPAIFAITRDTFIVYTSNVFAILGLRALYFLLASVMSMFRYLHVGLGVILAFVGVKMLLTEVYKIPALASLGVIVAVLATTIAVSLRAPRGEPVLPEHHPADKP